MTDLEDFKRRSDILVANSLSDDLFDVEDKVYTRDLYWYGWLLMFVLCGTELIKICSKGLTHTRLE